MACAEVVTFVSPAKLLLSCMVDGPTDDSESTPGPSAMDSSIPVVRRVWKGLGAHHSQFGSILAIVSVVALVGGGAIGLVSRLRGSSATADTPVETTAPVIATAAPAPTTPPPATTAPVQSAPTTTSMPEPATTLAPAELAEAASRWPTVFRADLTTPDAASSWDDYYTAVGSSLTIESGALVIAVTTQAEGDWVAYGLETADARLPADYLLSAEMRDVSGCKYGVMFNRDDNFGFGWIYIDNSADGPVLRIAGRRAGARDQTDVMAPVDLASFGVPAALDLLRLEDEYVALVNHRVAATFTHSDLEEAAGGPIVGSKIGLQTYTCALNGATRTYTFSSLTIRAPGALSAAP